MPCRASRTAVTPAKNARSSRSPSPRSARLAEPHVDDAVIRPGRGDITTTRSDRYTASGIECVTNTTAAPVSAQMREQLGLHALAGHLVEGAERLVHEQQARAFGQRPGDRDALLHAAGELVRVVLAKSASPTSVEQLGHARPRALGLADAVQLAAAADVAGHRAPRQQPGLLEGDAVVLVDGPGARSCRRP